MDYFNLIIYKIIVFYIPRKNRTIKKIYYKKTGIIENIKNNELSFAITNINRTLDTDYIVTIVNKKQSNNKNYDYYEKLNKKSEKQYQDMKNNIKLKQVNIDIKKDYFRIKYNNVMHDMDIIKKFIKDID